MSKKTAVVGVVGIISVLVGCSTQASHPETAVNSPSNISAGETTAVLKNTSISAKKAVPTRTVQRLPHQKTIYLTFDDGPSAYTNKVLSILNQYDAKATFFVLGQQVNENKETARKIVRDGHAIANHSWSHPDLTKLTAAAVNQQLTSTSRAIQRVTGYIATCMRPPYGATNTALTSAVAKVGLRQILWSVDTNDWQQPSVATLTSRIAAAKNGDIVLMHDGGGSREKTLAALTAAMPLLSAKNYHFAVVPTCSNR